MPGAARYVPATDVVGSQKLDEIADKERQQRKQLIDRYWRYYDGDHHRPLTVAPGEFDDNVIINLCGQAIDKSVSFFVPQAPKLTMPGETPGPSDDSPQQQRLDAFWQHNDLEAFVIDLALAGFISGHPFVKLLMGDEMPEVALLDSRHVTIFWDVTNVKRVLWYRLEWQITSDEIHRQDIVPAWLLAEEPKFDRMSAWKIIEYEKTRQSAGRWREVGQDDWPFPFAPIVQWKNAPRPHAVYGQSDLKPVDLNDGVNFVASNTARIIKHHAHPKTIVTGATLDDIKQTTIDGVFTLPDGAHATNLEMQSDLMSSMRMLETLRSAFFTQMRVVDWASQKDKVGQLTNFGLKVLFNDMLDNIENKRRVYGDGLAEISRRAMVMMGETGAERPTLLWKDALPRDRKETVESVKTEKELGITSLRTLAGELGRDYTAEQDQIAQEGSASTETFADALLTLRRQGAFNR